MVIGNEISNGAEIRSSHVWYLCNNLKKIKMFKSHPLLARQASVIQIVVNIRIIWTYSATCHATLISCTLRDCGVKMFHSLFLRRWQIAVDLMVIFHAFHYSYICVSISTCDPFCYTAAAHHRYLWCPCVLLQTFVAL